MRYASKEACLEAIRARISDSNMIPAQMKPELLENAEVYVSSFSERRTPSMHEMTTLNFIASWEPAKLYWVMKDDDLKLIESLSPTAIAIASYSVAGAGVVAGNPAVLAVSLITTVAILLYRVHKKSKFIEDKDYAVIMALKQLGPCTSSMLAESLNGIHIFTSNGWDSEQVEEVLVRLKTARLVDGTVVSFVAQDADGLWSTSGV